MPLVEMRFDELECGFFMYCEQLYFAFPHGKFVLYFPVKDGKIQRRSDESYIFDLEMITVIPLPEVSKYGMPINENENPMDSRFWSEPTSLR